MSISPSNTLVSAVVNNIKKGTIANSSLHGFGLFASEEIKASETIAMLDGQIVTFDYLKKGSEKSEWNALNTEQALYRPFQTKYYFINHSRTPNLQLKTSATGCLEIQALTDLQPGEELLLDYRKEPLPDWYLTGHGATYL